MLPIQKNFVLFDAIISNFLSSLSLHLCLYNYDTFALFSAILAYLQNYLLTTSHYFDSYSPATCYSQVVISLHERSLSMSLILLFLVHGLHNNHTFLYLFAAHAFICPSMWMFSISVACILLSLHKEACGMHIVEFVDFISLNLDLMSWERCISLLLKFHATF